MERRLAAIMFVDVVQSSRLMTEHEAAAIETIRQVRSETVEPEIAAHSGEILKRMGDGWIAAFASAQASTECAFALQTAMFERAPVKLRIGLHLGEIVFEEGDFHGAAVNLAQRLETEAPPGGVLASEDLHRQLPPDLANVFADAGEFRLRNIDKPVQAYQWRPTQGGDIGIGQTPAIVVETFAAAPADSATTAIAGDLRQQIMERLSRRIGVRILDGDAPEPGQSEYLLRGRLRAAGERARLHLALMLPAEARAVWSNTYEGDIADVFSFTDSVVDRADAHLRLQINAFDGDRTAGLADDELSVSELRSRAASGFYAPTFESWSHSLELIERALRLSPDDPMALAMRVEAETTLAAAQHQPLSPEALAALGQAADRAIEQAPHTDYMFWARALLNIYGVSNPAVAAKDVERTIALSPAYAPAYELLGALCMSLGQYRQAAQAAAKAVELSEGDPLQSYRCFLQATAYLLADAPEQALAAIAPAVQLRPRERNFHLAKAMALKALDRDAEAELAEADASRLAGGPSVLSPRPPAPADRADFANAFAPIS